MLSRKPPQAAAGHRAFGTTLDKDINPHHRWTPPRLACRGICYTRNVVTTSAQEFLELRKNVTSDSYHEEIGSYGNDNQGCFRASRALGRNAGFWFRRYPTNSTNPWSPIGNRCVNDVFFGTRYSSWSESCQNRSLVRYYVPQYRNSILCHPKIRNCVTEETISCNNKKERATSTPHRCHYQNVNTLYTTLWPTLDRTWFRSYSWWFLVKNLWVSRPFPKSSGSIGPRIPTTRASKVASESFWKRTCKIFIPHH